MAKIFRGKDITLMYAQLKLFFPCVTVAKPKSSRNSSIGPSFLISRQHQHSGTIEAFVVCRDFCLPEGYAPSMIDPLRPPLYGNEHPAQGPAQIIIPFVACGDLQGFDSDRNYPLKVS